MAGGCCHPAEPTNFNQVKMRREANAEKEIISKLGEVSVRFCDHDKKVEFVCKRR